MRLLANFQPQHAPKKSLKNVKKDAETMLSFSCEAASNLPAKP
jgi:hypothetical protein